MKNIPNSAQFCLVDIHPRHHKDLTTLTGSNFNLSPAARAKRKNEFYSGRWCAAQCLINKNEDKLAVQIGADRAPIWPVGVVGSISHSDQQAAALIDHTQHCLGIGLDIQANSSQALANDLKTTILHPLEITRFNHQYNAQLFDLIFSAKESLYKALYPRCTIFFDHQDAEVTNINRVEKTLQISLLRSLGHYWSKHQTFEINFDYLSGELVTWLYIKA